LFALNLFNRDDLNVASLNQKLFKKSLGYRQHIVQSHTRDAKTFGIIVVSAKPLKILKLEMVV
jgi:hypothetical protein